MAPLVSSALVEVEVPRALRRYSPAALVGVPAVFAKLYRMQIDTAIRATAAAYGDTALNSLDAIHLATAQLLATEAEGLDAFVAYDHRLLGAARLIGLRIASPGLRL